MELKPNIFILSRRLFRACGYDDVKKIIMEGETSKHPLLTSDYLAGQYAYYASTSIDKINLHTFKDELKFLHQMGVQINKDQALSVSKHLKNMLDNESARLQWY